MTTQSAQEAQRPVTAASTAGAMRLPLNVFVSYAHEDEAHRESLARHLSALEDEGLIRLWHDRKITAGREWAGAIDGALADAQIVLLLISADFLASDYCNDKELTEAIRLDDAGQARVVPVILRSCDWEHSRFAGFNALPADGAPIVEAEHPDQRFMAVAKGLRAIVAELTGSSPARRSAKGVEAPLAKASEATATTARKLKKFTIGEISLVGIKVAGPFEIPLPRAGAKSVLLGLAMVVLLAILVGSGVYLAALRGPLADARDAMRMARYDVALESLRGVPSWLAHWPELAAVRDKASLGIKTYQLPPDWESIGRELRRQRASRPTDADLMVLDAQYWLRKQEYDKARSLAEDATKEDQKNAEAWFLLGLDLDLSGDVPGAVGHYRKAADAAPDSPQYRSNLARGLLELGQLDEAIQQFRKISQFPLARVEQALGHWAKAETREAMEAQRDALKMLNDAALSKRFYNQRQWMFRLADKGIRLASAEDKRCYALLGETASRHLAGEGAAAFPPADCKDPPLEIRELVADDLCRFVDRPQPTLGATARTLRQTLGMRAECVVPAPSATPPRAMSGTSS